MSRIFLIHGWGGSPDSDWLPWAKVELAKKGYEVIAPSMPNTDTPVIDEWVRYLNEQVGELKSDDILVGHSIGCQTILRYLAKAKRRVDKVILVAPWFTLTNLESDEMWKLADPWFKTPMNFTKIKSKANTFITLFSDDDSWVPYEENVRLFRERLNPTIVTVHAKGHMTADEGITVLPELLHLFK